jgi:subtilisin family serine protease
MEKRRLTGRKLVVLAPGAERAAVASALADTELNLTVASDFGGTVPGEVRDRADVVLFDRVGTMLVARRSMDATNLISRLDAEGQIIAVEDEGYVFAIGASGGARAQSDYLRGYREGVQHLVGLLAGTPACEAGALRLDPRAAERAGARAPLGARAIVRSACEQPRPEPSEMTSLAGEATSPAVGGFDESAATWGLQAIGALRSPFTGRGVKVALLDTGYDRQHADFVDRRIVTKSVVAGEEVQDWHGHGTHTAGTLSGPLSPSGLPRYGIAYEAELHICKVLDNCGVGRDGDVLDGINWALENGCRVISMSLGAPSEHPLEVYRLIGMRALQQNALIIAAAGNDSHRGQGRIVATRSPANAETILAVAALDARRNIADFSNGGKIDITAPGVQIYSSYRCGGYRCLSGTSMATPHVAGVVALLMQANPSMRAPEIRDLLKSSALSLDAPREAVGAGLVQAPMAPS